MEVLGPRSLFELENSAIYEVKIAIDDSPEVTSLINKADVNYICLKRAMAGLGSTVTASKLVSKAYFAWLYLKMQSASTRAMNTVGIFECVQHRKEQALSAVGIKTKYVSNLRLGIF
jgi:hypothetical protein